MRSSDVTVQFEKLFDKETAVDDTYRTVMRGFLHPHHPAAPSPPSVFLAAAATNVKLYISTDDSPDNKVKVVMNNVLDSPDNKVKVVLNHVLDSPDNKVKVVLNHVLDSPNNKVKVVCSA